MKRLVAAIAVLMALALSGCAGELASAKSTPSRTAPGPTAPAKPAATAKQFASVLAEHSDWFKEFDEGVFECITTTLNYDPKAFATNVKAMTCSLKTQTAPMKASIIAKDWEKLGDAPAEVASLVQKTETSLNALKLINTDACKAPTANSGAPATAGTVQDEKCLQVFQRVRQPVSDLVGQMKAWRPYMGSA